MDGWMGWMSTPDEMTQQGEVPLILAEWLVSEGFLDNHMTWPWSAIVCSPGRGGTGLSNDLNAANRFLQPGNMGKF